MNKIDKSGCIVFNKDKTKVALIYRDFRNDYTFPKGHIENNESLIECAIRETEEEIKIKPIIENENQCYIETYESFEGIVNVYYYIAYDGGISDNKSLDTHEVLWTSIDDVENKLSYDSTIKMWKKIKENLDEH
ncbi:MAG: NUDIX domain-containing protein [bacterium]|nr:NUDIX domain-containing protein [bacterium]